MHGGKEERVTGWAQRTDKGVQKRQTDSPVSSSGLRAVAMHFRATGIHDLADPWGIVGGLHVLVLGLLCQGILLGEIIGRCSPRDASEGGVPIRIGRIIHVTHGVGVI